MHFAASGWFLSVSVLCLIVNIRTADGNSSDVFTSQGRETGSSSSPESEVRQRSRDKQSLANFACALRRDENYRLTEALRMIVDSKRQRHQKPLPINRQNQLQLNLRRAERDERTAAVVESLISSSNANLNKRRKVMLTSLPWVPQRQSAGFSQDAVVNRRSPTGNRYADQMAEISRQLAGSNLYADEDEDDEAFYDDENEEGAEDETGTDNEDSAGGRLNSFQRSSDSNAGTLNPLMRVVNYNAPPVGGGRMLSRTTGAA